MSITPATAYGTQMTKLIGNANGAIQQLLSTLVSHGRERCFIEDVPLASQVSGTVIAVARLPCPFTMVGISLLTDTSLGSTTIALGNAADSNSAIYKAAGTFTSINTPTSVGLIGTLGVPVYSGIDALTGLPTTYVRGGNGGGGYEDIILTTGAATAPASGTLRLFFRYMVD